MVQAFFLALRQLFEPRTLWVVVKVVVLTLLLFILFGVAGYFGLRAVAPQLGYKLGDDESALIAFLVTFGLGFFLFRAVAILVMGIFSDEIVELVEEKYYPEAAAKAKPVSIAHGLKLGLQSAGRAVGYNLLALPVYIAVLVTGIGLVVALVAVNGLLLGRDLQDMVMARHKHDGLMTPLPRSTRIGLGLIVALLFLIPFVNFLAPVIGAAMAVHLVHRRPADTSSRMKT